ncbi:hypothetical protein [Acidisphaera sp. S103]|uniref:hypothetical protein n=1 Tax=Acidisphaera sp. S103 TaxID=1747223 RepID=UPI00131ECA31|nr:hypothetical protein [Acidisphaera sp. S103]
MAEDEPTKPAFDRYAAGQQMLLEEYKRYEAELLQNETMLYQIERYFLVAIAAIYTWISTQTTKVVGHELVGHAIWIPIVMSVIMLFRMKGFNDDSQKKLDHIRRIERMYLSSDPQPSDIDLKWRSLREPLTKERHEWLKCRGISKTWLAILGITTVVALRSDGSLFLWLSAIVVGPSFIWFLCGSDRIQKCTATPTKHTGSLS